MLDNSSGPGSLWFRYDGLQYDSGGKELTIVPGIGLFCGVTDGAFLWSRR